MSTTLITSFELGAQGEFWTDQATYSTVHKRSGSYGAFFNGQSNIEQYIRLSGGTFLQYALSASFWLKIVALPTTGTVTLFALEDTVPTRFDRLQITSTGALVVTDGTNSATSTFTLSVDGQFHLIEFDCGWSSGSGRRVRVDGVEWASTAVGTSVKKEGIRFGVLDTSNGCQVAFDDMVIDNDTFANTGYPGSLNVTLLLPVSDNTPGSWVGGAGGTTNVYSGADSVPPAGVASASATDSSQIKNATTGGNQDGKFNCQTYAAAGITGNVVAVMPICNDSSSAATIAGALWIDSNPAQTAPGQTFDYGNASVAATFPSGWKTHVGPVSLNPSVTLGSSPVVAIRKTTNTANIAFADLLGVYVAWKPGTTYSLDLSAHLCEFNVQRLA